MSIKEYFIIGCKAFGVYSLYLSVPATIALIQVLLSSKGIDSSLSNVYLVTKITSLLMPLFYISAGVYLLRGGKFLQSFSRIDGSHVNFKEMEGKFFLLLKFLGMYLVVQYLPSFFEVLSSFWVLHNAPKYMEMFQERQYVYYNFLPSMVGMLLGVYLIRSGKFFIKIASINDGKFKDDRQ